MSDDDTEMLRRTKERRILQARRRAGHALNALTEAINDVRRNIDAGHGFGSIVRNMGPQIADLAEANGTIDVLLEQG